MHQHTVKLADFGLSRRLQQSVCYIDKACDVIPYMDPNTFNIQDEEGLTSRLPPFDHKTQPGYFLITEITNGRRETPIPFTNANFIKSN